MNFTHDPYGLAGDFSQRNWLRPQEAGSQFKKYFFRWSLQLKSWSRERKNETSF